MPDGTEVRIAQSQGIVEANWVSQNKKYRFTGTVSNLGMKLTIYKEQYAWWTENKFQFGEDSTGYAYQTPNREQLFIMVIKEGKHSFMDLARKR